LYRQGGTVNGIQNVYPGYAGGNGGGFVWQ
jgi:hypothetical protein